MKPWQAILWLVAQIINFAVIIYIYSLMWEYYSAGDKPDLFLLAAIAAAVWSIDVRQSINSTRRTK